MLRWTKGIFDTEEITVVRMREQDEEFCKILRVTIEKGSIGSNARLIESISDGRNDLRNAFSANSPRTISARSMIETCRLQPIENPFGPKVLPMFPE